MIYFVLAFSVLGQAVQDGALLELTGEAAKVEFGGALTLIHNSTEDKLVCSGKNQASDVIIEGSATTVADLIIRSALPPPSRLNLTGIHDSSSWEVVNGTQNRAVRVSGHGNHGLWSWPIPRGSSGKYYFEITIKAGAPRPNDGGWVWVAGLHSPTSSGGFRHFHGVYSPTVPTPSNPDDTHDVAYSTGSPGQSCGSASEQAWPASPRGMVTANNTVGFAIDFDANTIDVYSNAAIADNYKVDFPLLFVGELTSQFADVAGCDIDLSAMTEWYPAVGDGTIGDNSGEFLLRPRPLFTMPDGFTYWG